MSDPKGQDREKEKERDTIFVIHAIRPIYSNSLISQKRSATVSREKHQSSYKRTKRYFDSLRGSPRVTSNTATDSIETHGALLANPVQIMK